MPTTSAGIYEVVLKQTYAGQVVLNVFSYLDLAGLDDKQGVLASAFDTAVLPSIQTLQNTFVAYTDIICRNLTGILADVTIPPTTAAGSVVGATCTTFVACPFRYNRISKETRNGSKRFTGMVEENIVSDAFIVAYQTIMTTAAAVFGANVMGGGSSFAPIILRKPPDVAGVYTYNSVANVQPLNRQSSQNSRKVY